MVPHVSQVLRSEPSRKKQNPRNLLIFHYSFSLKIPKPFVDIFHISPQLYTEEPT